MGSLKGLFLSWSHACHSDKIHKTYSRLSQVQPCIVTFYMQLGLRNNFYFLLNFSLFSCSVSRRGNEVICFYGRVNRLLHNLFLPEKQLFCALTGTAFCHGTSSGEEEEEEKYFSFHQVHVHLIRKEENIFTPPCRRRRKVIKLFKYLSWNISRRRKQILRFVMKHIEKEKKQFYTLYKDEKTVTFLIYILHIRVKGKNMFPFLHRTSQEGGGDKGIIFYFLSSNFSRRRKGKTILIFDKKHLKKEKEEKQFYFLTRSLSRRRKRKDSFTF